MQRILVLLALIVSFFFGTATLAAAKSLGAINACTHGYMEKNGISESAARHIQIGTTFDINGRPFIVDGIAIRTLWGACEASEQGTPALLPVRKSSAKSAPPAPKVAPVMTHIAAPVAVPPSIVAQIPALAAAARAAQKTPAKASAPAAITVVAPATPVQPQPIMAKVVQTTPAQPQSQSPGVDAPQGMLFMNTRGQMLSPLTASAPSAQPVATKENTETDYSVLIQRARANQHEHFYSPVLRFVSHWWRIPALVVGVIVALIALLFLGCLFDVPFAHAIAYVIIGTDETEEPEEERFATVGETEQEPDFGDAEDLDFDEPPATYSHLSNDRFAAALREIHSQQPNEPAAEEPAEEESHRREHALAR